MAFVVGRKVEQQTGIAELRDIKSESYHHVETAPVQTRIAGWAPFWSYISWTFILSI